MEPINNNMLDGIRNYLSMESTGALMVSGEWGCGKTYHIEKVVMPALQQDGWNPVKGHYSVLSRLMKCHFE